MPSFFIITSPLRWFAENPLLAMMLRHAVLFMSLSSALGLSIGGVGSVRPASPPARASRVRAVAELVRTDSPPPASLSGALPDCPATIWDADALDVDMWQKKYKDENLAACPIEVVATDAANAQGEEYFLERRDEFKEMLATHGTIWFRGFELMKDPAGFRSFWESLQLDPCLDPIHTSGLRKFLSKGDAVYEEVRER